MNKRDGYLSLNIINVLILISILIVYSSWTIILGNNVIESERLAEQYRCLSEGQTNLVKINFYYAIEEAISKSTDSNTFIYNMKYKYDSEFDKAVRMDYYKLEKMKIYSGTDYREYYITKDKRFIYLKLLSEYHDENSDRKELHLYRIENPFNKYPPTKMKKGVSCDEIKSLFKQIT